MLENTTGTRLTAIAKDPIEKIHLSFLKWNLGVGRKTSNAAIWGDTGRLPLIIKISKQVCGFYKRLEDMSSDNATSCLVKHASNEQKRLNMNWYKRMNFLNDLLQSQSNVRLNFPSQLRSRLGENFKTIWNKERLENRKLKFYISLKSSFEAEKYIDSNLNYKELKRLS